MDLRDAIIRQIQAYFRNPDNIGALSDRILSIFQDTLDNITDTEELSELQRKIATMLEKA